jgi:hypothetical protein
MLSTRHNSGGLQRMAQIIHLCDIHKERGIKCLNCEIRARQFLGEMLNIAGPLPDKPEGYEDE